MSEEKSLTLIVTEKKLGSLITNAKDIQKFVAEKLETYSVDDYKGDEKQAAKDKAELNNAAKQLNDERIRLEKEWLSPFQEFKDVVTETTNMIKTASSKLDAIVKAKEEQEKNKKREEITELWNTKNFTLVSLEKVFNSKWLNKTYKMATIAADIDLIIQTVNADLAALDAFGEDTALLKDLYLTTLNLQTTLNKGAELKANRERLAQEEQKKAAAEKETKIKKEVEPVIEVDFQKHEVKAVEQKKTNGVVYKFNVYGEKNEVESVKAIAEELNLTVVPSITLSGSIEEINVFKSLLTNNGLTYEKTGIINLFAKRS